MNVRANLSLIIMWVLVLSLARTACAQSPEDFAPQNDQFNFWLGEWDVNLKVRQPDNLWKDQHQAIARIYSLLGGQAILELWEEQGRDNGIIGYSIRYYDPSIDKWVLWLNWPGQNRSATTSLAGVFRHGRGEFFGERQINDSTVMVSRYTFSDITKNSLRWDDAYSTDGGKTWSNNWIMEFSRRNDTPTPLAQGTGNLTNTNQNRCNLQPFEIITRLSKKGVFTKSDSKVTFYGILEGCAVMTSVRKEKYEEFSVLTFNTHANVYEQLVYDKTLKKAAIYYGILDGETIKLTTKAADFKEVRLITIQDDMISLRAFDSDKPDEIMIVY